MADALPLPNEQSVGQRLKSAREDANLTIDDISESLKISKSVVTALEAEDVDHLPGHTFTHGYLRAYSKLLGLPADEIVEGYAPLPEHAASGRTQTSGRTQKSLYESHRDAEATLRLKKTIALAVGAIAVGLLLSWLFRGGQPSEPAQAVPQPSAVAPGTVVKPDTQTTTPAPGKPKTPVSAAPKIEHPMPPAAQTETPVTQQPAAPAPSPAPATPAVTPLPDIEGLPEITFTFRGDCWVDVEDARGAKLIYKLGKQDQVTKVKGLAPFKVIIGNAPMVEVQYNGTVIDITAGSRSPYISTQMGKAEDNPPLPEELTPPADATSPTPDTANETDPEE